MSGDRTGSPGVSSDDELEELCNFYTRRRRLSQSTTEEEGETPVAEAAPVTAPAVRTGRCFNLRPRRKSSGPAGGTAEITAAKFPKEKRRKYGHKCAICLQNRADYYYAPCFHLCVCISCKFSPNFKLETKNYNKLCPMCGVMTGRTIHRAHF